MKYNSKTKKCTCEVECLEFDDVCDACKVDYELWCDELAVEVISEITQPTEKIKKLAK